MAMNLAAMANFVCTKVGQFDATSVTLCKGFINSRYQMVYDAFYWRDSGMSASATLLAGVQTFPYPANMDRISTIRSGGDHFLDPVDPAFLIESYPEIFEESGTPIFYEEDTTTPNSYRVTVYPTPVENTSFLILGKRTCPGMVLDADTSILRNCDNAIIAFAMGDMLERARQYAKAQAKFQEAAEHLKTAKAIETEQANQPRKTKMLTVAGNSLLEMTDAVCGTCGQWSPDTRILVQEFLRRNYQVLYDMALWPESCLGVYLQFNGQQLVLPEYVDRVIAVRGGDSLPLTPAEIGIHFQLDPFIFEQTGSAYAFSMLTPVGVAVLPPFAPEALRFSSTSPLDKGPVFVSGESGGDMVTETVTLNGTTFVNTVNAYDVPITVAKNVTNGDVTVNGATSMALLELIPAGEREQRHLRIWLLPDPGTNEDGQTCLVLAKRKIKPLRTDQDTPIITGCQAVLIAGASADLMQRLGNNEQSQSFRQRAEKAAQMLASQNTDQSAYMPRFIPEVEPSALSWGGCYYK
jgi:hypothetical protein